MGGRRAPRVNLTPGGLLAALEGWLTGYRSEHYKLGLQMGACFAITLLPILLNRVYSSLDRSGSVLYQAVTVAVVLEPNTGDSFRKLLMRVLGAGCAGGIGMLLLFCAVGSNTYDNYVPSEDNPYLLGGYQEALSKWVIPGMAILGFILMINHQRYWRSKEFWQTAIFTLPIVTIPAIRSSPAMYYEGAAYRMANVVIGIAVAALVSFVLFPVRARGLLQRKMASTLIKIGDLAVWLVGQVCVPPQPGSEARIPGSSSTDTKCIYADDGLHVKMAPLMATASELTADLAYMGKLLEAASAEFYIIRTPHTFPTKQYKMLLDACHVVLGIFLSLLYALEGGEVTLQICSRHIGDLSEAGVRLSAGFTALSSLIRPPKAKKKRRWPWQRGKEHKQHHKAAAALKEGSPEVVAAAAVAELEQEEQRRRLEKADSAATALAAGTAVLRPAPSDVESGDDPFAALADGRAEHATPAKPSVVALTDAELKSAQLIARHLSAVVMRRASVTGRGPAYAPDANTVGRSSPLSPLMDEEGEGGSGGIVDGGEADMGMASGPGGGGKGASVGKASMGVAGLGAGGSGDERREWVLLKLRALVDSIHQLEEAASRERETHSSAAGLPAFMLVVHSCINLTRQCGACFTALDPERGAQLHAYFRAIREGRIMGPVR